MAAEPHYIDVDLKKKTQFALPTVTQNDTDTVFVLRVTDEGRSGNDILDDFSTITLTSERKDKQAFYIAGEKIDGTNEVRFILGTKELELIGKVTASVQFYSADGRKSSAHFHYEVEKDLTGNYEPTETEVSLIESVLVEGPRIMSEAEQATLEAIQAMNDLTGAVNGALDTLEADKQQAFANFEAEKDAALENFNTEKDIALEGLQSDKLTALDEIRVAREETESATSSAVEATAATSAEREATEVVRLSTQEAEASALAGASAANEQASYAKDQGDYAKTQGDVVRDLLNDGPVVSVNGQTGEIVLDAAAVGAITAEEADTKDAAVLQSAKEYAAGLEPDLGPIQREIATHKADDAAHGIGDKTALLTADKVTLVGAVNELFTNVSDGKSLVGGAITGVDPNVVIPADPTFQQLVGAIGQISTGKKIAVGEVTGLPATGTVQVTGLPFVPSAIFLKIRYFFLGTYRLTHSVSFPIVADAAFPVDWFNRRVDGSSANGSGFIKTKPSNNTFAITTDFGSTMTDISATWIAVEGVGFFG